jgi:hypothetical protein
MKHLGPVLALMSLASLAAGCAREESPAAPTPGGSGGRGGVAGAAAGASGAEGRGGAVGSGGGSPTAPSPDAGSIPNPDSEPTPDSGVVAPDASTGKADGFTSSELGATPMTTDGGPPPSYEGEIPIHYGPEVGPMVEMQCPGDPAEGWTEYQDTFHLEHPFRVPANTRFSITGGIYNFTVFPNDSPHSPMAMGRNPRTEATYGGLRDKANVGTRPGVYAKVAYFTSGQRMYSTDMLITPSAYGSAIVQIHTTSPGGGPIGLRLSGGNLTNNGATIINGSSVPGGLQNKWFNFKAAFNTADRQVRIWINNCLKATYTGARGDGRYYFKNGVYFCDDGGGCRTHFKNVHFYEK